MNSKAIAKATPTDTRPILKSFKVIGLPGTGKTTKLISMLGQFLAQGFSINDIIFCSHTRTAVSELKERISTKFGLSIRSLRKIRTMHALSLQLLQEHMGKIAHRDQFLSSLQRFHRQFALTHINRVSGYFRFNDQDSMITIDDGLPDFTEIDVLADIEIKHIICLFNQFLVKYPKQFSSVIEGCRINTQFLEDFELEDEVIVRLNELFVKYYIEYQQMMTMKKLFSFDDQLHQVAGRKLIPTGKVLIIDEFQDLSPLQYRLFEIWSPHMEIVVVAGDPHQAIYGFQHATPKFIEEFRPTEKTILLDVSYRLPSKIIAYTKEQMDSEWLKTLQASESDYPGSVDHLDLTKLSSIPFFESQTIMVLCRSNYIKETVKSLLIDILPDSKEMSGKTKKKIEILMPIILKVYHQKGLSGKELLILFGHIPEPNPYEINNTKHLLSFPKHQSLRELVAQHLNDGSDGLININVIIQYPRIFIPKFIQLNFPKSISALLVHYVQKYDDYEDAKDKFVVPWYILFKTIHQAKGEEADLIIVVDTATQFELKEMVDEDEERRVWYVAITRARKHLVIAEGQEEKGTKFLV